MDSGFFCAVCACDFTQMMECSVRLGSHKVKVFKVNLHLRELFPKDFSSLIRTNCMYSQQ